MAGGLTPPGAAPGTGEPLDRYAPQAVRAAADNHGVPESILLGVWGMETGFGQNVQTSSAGAVGDFQFLPSTAKGYNYPLTNSPSALQFQQQANAAAQYLSDLYKQYGSWDAALQHYSGGGYGQFQVLAKAKEYHPPHGVNFSGIIDDVPGVKQVKSVTDAVATIVNVLTDIQTWIRVGEAIAGMVLVFLGLKTLTGVSVPVPVPV